MRHYAGMKAILCLPLVFASCAWADDAADRVAIGQVIASLNELTSRTAVIADSPAAAGELAALRLRKLSIQGSGLPSVTISHEPWGEATINFPNFPGNEVLPGKIVAGAIRFITPKVALADGDLTRADGVSVHEPILFVMKKVGNEWKIASVRMLAPPVPAPPLTPPR
jgi:hypothetical protein